MHKAVQFPTGSQITMRGKKKEEAGRGSVHGGEEGEREKLTMAAC